MARRLLELVGSLPSLVWGRDELGTGEMWNSNSVIAILAKLEVTRRAEAASYLTRHTTIPGS